MTFLAGLLGGGDVVKAVGGVLDDLFTSDEEREEAKLELVKAERDYHYKIAQLESEQNLGQMRVNEAEAKSGKLFIAGWRPAIGWIGALALGYQFILYPLMTWAWAMLQAKAWIPSELSPPPVFESGPLFTIITGMLGIAGLRSYDKLKATDTKKI